MSNITVRKRTLPHRLPVQPQPTTTSAELLTERSKRIRRSNTRYNSDNFVVDVPTSNTTKNKNPVVKSEPEVKQEAQEYEILTEIKQEKLEEPVQLKVRPMEELMPSKSPTTSPSSILTIHKEYTSDSQLMNGAVPCAITVKLPKSGYVSRHNFQPNYEEIFLRSLLQGLHEGLQSLSTHVAVHR